MEGDLKELTKSDAYISRTCHKIFISQFVIHLGSQRSAKLTPQSYVPFPPQGGSDHRIFFPAIKYPVRTLVEEERKPVEPGFVPSITCAKANVPAVTNNIHQLCLRPKPTH